MGMNNSALAYEQVQSPEQQIRVLEEQKSQTRANAQRAKAVKLVMTVSFVFVALFALTFMSASNYSLGVELNAVKSQIADTQTMTARAGLELGELSSRARVEAYAIANLGMVYPATDDVYFLGEESSRAIAAAISNETETVAAEAPVEQSGWEKFVAAVAGFFKGDAYAAEQ